MPKPERSLASHYLSGSTAHSGGPTTRYWVLGSSLRKFKLFQIVGRFTKKWRLQQPLKIIQTQHLGTRGFDFRWFWMTIWDHFLSNFMIQRKLSNCNMCNAKYLFLLITASRFGIKNSIKNMFFQDAFLDTFFLHFMLMLCESCRFGDPFNIQWAAKSARHRPVSGIVNKRM